jgi:pimeloyl-ACP methyl ester carboxylesterase
MNTFMRAVLGAAIIVLALTSNLSAQSRTAIESRFAVVTGVRLHYLVAGKGDPVLLLDGYAENSHMWRPLMAQLAKSHTVIAPDLRGFGQSSKPMTGYDKKTTAQDIHALALSLGYHRETVVGHDIGLMVAYCLCGR